MNASKLRQLVKEIVAAEIVKHGVDTDVGMNTMKAIHRDKLINELGWFTEQYIETALWISTESINTPPENTDDEDEDDEDDVEGDEWKHTQEPEEPSPQTKDTYTAKDIATQTLEKMKADCKDFYDKYSEMYHNAGWSDDRAAHDFWLTRNRHGAGFWSREQDELDPELYGNMSYEQFEDIKDALTKAAHSYGEFNLYLGDDGLIYGG
jgi:hypothetical protein